MAEFIDVVKNKNEMCNYYGICNKCPLSSKNNSYTLLCCEDFINYHTKEAEEIIMAWEKPVDWSKVKVDTPILVRNNENNAWTKRYFAKYEDDKVFAWMYGATSWTDDDKNDTMKWEYAKLAEEGDAE